MKEIRVGLLGIGTIGNGTYQTLKQGKENIKASTGLDIEIVRILCRETEIANHPDIPAEKFTTNAEDILAGDDIDIVIELIGGVQPATDFMATALKNGKHVVTANKAAIAANGKMLQQLAQENQTMLRFEASVGGGIPILNAITTALLADEFEAVHGILNGTTNYILTKMGEEGASYEDVLKVAQDLGFAEADPTADVEGHDAANKLSILMSLVFGVGVSPEDIPCRGITTMQDYDFRYAKENGYCIKLLASARKEGTDIYGNVEPVLVPLSHPLAGVNNEFNAVFVRGKAVDDLMFYGKGAGAMPTGTAVMGDVIAIAKQIDKETAYDVKPLLRFDSENRFAGEGESPYYIRVSAVDQSGVLGNIAATFGRHGISIESMVQRGSDNAGGEVPLVFVVYKTARTTLDEALAELVEKNYVASVNNVIRVES